MEQNRTIVLILGNGFDLNLGRKTSYRDFWKSRYCPQDYPAPLIRHLNSTWEENSDDVKWYDLENELLEYFKSTTKEEFKDLVSKKEREFLSVWKKRNENVINAYKDYEEQIDSLIEKGFLTLDKAWQMYMECKYRDELTLDRATRDRNALRLIKNGLCSYLKEIEYCDISHNSVAISILAAMRNALENKNVVKIYTFNYTSLPLIYESDLSPQYIHGKCQENDIIIGTKDSAELNRDYDFLQKSFDLDYKTPPVVLDLLNADDVIIFGHSLGMNDSQYFEPFFSQQVNHEKPRRKNITIFTKNEQSVLEIKRSLQELTKYKLSLLNSLNELEIFSTDSIPQNNELFYNFLSRFVSDKHYLKELVSVK